MILLIIPLKNGIIIILINMIITLKRKIIIIQRMMIKILVKIYFFFLRDIIIIKYNNNFEQSAGNQIYIFYILSKDISYKIIDLITIYYNNIIYKIIQILKYMPKFKWVCYKLFILYIIYYIVSNILYLLNIIIRYYNRNINISIRNIYNKIYIYRLKGSSETTRDRYNNNIKGFTSIKNIIVRYSPIYNKNNPQLNGVNNILLFKRYNSTINTKLGIESKDKLNKLLNNNNIKPILIYNSLYNDRLNIYKILRNKTGIYCLFNNINGNYYIDSSINISGRMKNYLNKCYLKNKNNKNIPINKALLKYNTSNFTLYILEYTNINILNIRETYYISKLLPYYNVLLQSYTSLGYKHTKETKILLSKLAKNRKHSDETKSLISKSLTGINNPFINKKHSIENINKIILSKSKIPLYIYDYTKNLLVIFPSITTLSKLINTNYSTIMKYKNEELLFKGSWYFRQIPYNIKDKPIINNWRDIKMNNIILDIKNSKINKAIFLFDLDYNLIKIYDGVTAVEKHLKINHSLVKKYASVNGQYKNYIFSYEYLTKDIIKYI